MTEEQGKDSEASQSPEDRLEEIKKEAKEDASTYYEQGESKDKVNEEAELSKPVEDVNAQKEEMNMLKAVAFLGFGMAALAIIFILFFVRDLDTRVVDVDGAVTSLEEKIAPLRKHVDTSLEKVNQDIAGLDSKIGNYERVMAVMELKRALVTVQEISMGNSANVTAKSNQVVAGIESLLVELGAGTSSTKMPAGTVSLEEAPAAPLVEHVAPAEEPVHAEEPVEEAAPVEETAPVEEAAAEEEPASAPEEAEESDDGGDEEEDEDDE
jgi:DNA-binding protein Fis